MMVMDCSSCSHTESEGEEDIEMVGIKKKVDMGEKASKEEHV